MGAQIESVVVAGLAGSWLMCELAAAALANPSQNRSTGPRWAAVLLSAGLAAVLLRVPETTSLSAKDVLLASLWLAHYWVIAGSVMLADSSRIPSPMRRRFPRRFWSRSLLDLSLPGPGRGYLFALTQLTGWMIALVGIAWLYSDYPHWWTEGANSLGTWRPPFWKSPAFIGIAFSWLNATLFLSISYLVWNWSAHRLGREVRSMFGLLVAAAVYGVVQFIALMGHLLGLQPGEAMSASESVYSRSVWAWSGYREAMLSSAVVESSLWEYAGLIWILTASAVALTAMAVHRACRELLREGTSVVSREPSAAAAREPSRSGP